MSVGSDNAITTSALREANDKSQVNPDLELLQYEVFWRDHQVWLQSKGYMLRPRYHPNWVSSSLSHDPERCYPRAEDAVIADSDCILDAQRIATGELVILKKVSKTYHPDEALIQMYLNFGALATHPHNHCAPLHEVLQSPYDEDTMLLVLPLYRSFDSPPFKTVGEIVEFFRQIFEGLKFMHDCGVAHRDCGYLNIMMDGTNLYPEGFHPMAQMRHPSWNQTLAKHYTRTRAPVKYYFIDFGISCMFDPGDPDPREWPIRAGDKSAPEIRDDLEGPINPFPTDVYYIGNLIRTEIGEDYRGIDFMDELVADMVQADPMKRPTMDVVVKRFEEIRRSLSWWKLRQRLRKPEEDQLWLLTFLRDVPHFFRVIRDITMLRSAVPMYKQ
ncbi:hypothetical protein NLI96_g10605 [Meripilus lineatus]|uniref:Protein kinase domain-containing protein n=1 Tax=Meripilus lineatus TaxID=2056292 RepID=A0AAD5YE27_9APHY|nr:hypothetical protein NLI96_g10605 [Physisporinus lineatus]